jgi:hypothetical protein
MRSLLNKDYRVLFITGWIIINLIQAGATELFDDEAYYWVYSRFLSWGYFDHPPMIAILIKAGYAIFENELGVRLFIVLMNGGTIILISRLIDPINNKLFYAIALSIAVAHVGGMIAVPDVPLLFFVALFFLAYKQFLRKMNFLNSVKLGVCISLMLYTKYHGILIVFFTMLSNIKLLKKYQIYIVFVVSFLLFFPHVYWQCIHDFPSVRYHLIERNASTYRVGFTIEFILSQLLLAGPIIGWLLLWSSFKYKPGNGIERALKYTLVGFYAFFMLSTFKGRVEANWTIPAFISIMILSYEYLKDRPQIADWLYKAVPVTLLLAFIVRGYMMLDVTPALKTQKAEFHGSKIWADSVRNQANGLPVVFLNSYQWASKHWFYAGTPALGMNTPYYRRNNYNFWPIEDLFFGRTVYVIGDYDTVVLKNEIKAPRVRRTGSVIIPEYYSFMKAEFSDVKNEVFGDGVVTSFNVKVPNKYLTYFQNSSFDTASIQLAILRIEDTIKYFPSSIKVKQITMPDTKLSVKFNVRLPKGIYEARLGISTAIPGHPSMNSPGFEIKFK